jgi:hypothetical protein
LRAAANRVVNPGGGIGGRSGGTGGAAGADPAGGAPSGAAPSAAVPLPPPFPSQLGTSGVPPAGPPKALEVPISDSPDEYGTRHALRPAASDCRPWPRPVAGDRSAGWHQRPSGFPPSRCRPRDRAARAVAPRESRPTHLGVPGGHGGRRAQRLMDANEIVIQREKRDRMRVVFDLL